MVLRRPLCCAQWPAIPNLRGATAALVHDVKQPLSVRARGSGQRCANDWGCLAKSPPGSGQRLGLFGQIAARVWPTIGAVWPSGQRCANDWGCLAKWPSGQRCANDWGGLAEWPTLCQRLGLFGQVANVVPTIGAVWPSGQVANVVPTIGAVWPDVALAGIQAYRRGAEAAPRGYVY
jgi:hypothetical protein